MKRLLGLICIVAAVNAMGQKNNSPSSFNIQKQAKDTAKTKGVRPVFSVSTYWNVKSYFHKHGVNPSQHINAMEGIDVFLPITIAHFGNNALGSGFGMGFYDCYTAQSPHNVSTPFVMSLGYGSKTWGFGLHAGQRYFFHSTDSLLSENVVFEWGAGFGFVKNLSRMRSIGLGVNYIRMINENFVHIQLSLDLL